MAARLFAAAVLAAALGAGGCSVATPTSPPPETISGGTPRGLNYTLEITTRGAQRCTTATYRSKLPDGRAVLQGSHTCANAAALPRHPLLVQARTSPQALLIDVSPTGCGLVRGGPTHATARPLSSRCSSGKPVYRVTLLPALKRVALVGVPGAPVINFPRHICTMGLCLTPLA
jgi:hypothetical protein